VELVVTDSRSPFHLCGIADEFAREAAVDGVGVPDVDSLVNAAPLELERHRSGNGRRPTTEEGISDVSVVEDRDLNTAQGSTALPEVDLNIVGGNLEGPEEANGRECARIEIMQLIARTGRIDIHSYEGEGPLVDAPVRSFEDSGHEAHVGIDEWQAYAFAGFSVRPGDHPTDVGQADKAVEVGGGCGFGIDGIDGGRAEHMVGPSQYRRTARNRNGGKGGRFKRHRIP